MKKQHLVLASVMLMLTVLTGNAQDPVFNPHSVKNIPFGKKLPPPDGIDYPDKLLPQMISPGNSDLRPTMAKPNANAIKKSPEYFRQLLRDMRKTPTSLFPNEPANSKRENENDSTSNFHLLKDINAISDGNPRNFTSHTYGIPYDPRNDSVSYAVLDNLIYFAAEDGIHGTELWRSDGTGTGTYMVKDITPGETGTLFFNITAVNGKIYFTAYGPGSGSEPWISDGTDSGTHLLMDIFADGSSDPKEYFAIGKQVYFTTNGASTWSAIWKTDGTTAGTQKVIDIGEKGNGGEQIFQPTVVNGILFFTFFDYETGGWSLWRSDGTDSGTYRVYALYPDFDNHPAQLTNCNNKLYFSAKDSAGRKLWVSDGTITGTTLAPGNHGVLIDADYLGTSFPIRKNVLYIPGQENKTHGLYKYDASNTAGLVRIKYFAPVGDTAFIVPVEIQLVKNTVYFKVVNYNGGIHDELWSSQGTQTSTHLVQKFLPGETIKNIYNGSGICYFVKYDKFFGTELWRTVETSFGTFPIPVRDIFKGPASSYPAYLTAFNGKLIFAAGDENGSELHITDGTPGSANLVKNINTVTTPGSNAGFNFYNFQGYRGMVALGNEVLFNAYEKVHGYELYKSDGTAKATGLLNDVIPGEEGFNVQQFISKDSIAYFTVPAGGRYAIYTTKGTKNSLRKITPDHGYIQSFAVADNGLVFYAGYDNFTSAYKLWRTDGTTAGTVLLSSALYNLNYLNVIGNTAVFVAGDSLNGNELWKSDGSVAGTKLIKDINPGTSSANPGGLFLYKNAVYFSAYDSTSSHPSFWKSNGTASGTIKLKDVDPYWGNTLATTARYFCVSNNILYFSAINHSNTEGAKLWRTDGTPEGTRPIKDINPTSDNPRLNPYLLTDVNGTIFFIDDDGVHGRELWKSDGHYEGTQLVKDITTGANGSTINGLTSFGGKLFFQNAVNNRYYLWTSDGTPEGTHAVEDPGIINVGIAAIFAAGNKLFLSGNTATYGTELYVGKVDDQTGKLVMSRATNEKTIRSTLSFNAVLFPNPVLSNARLQVSGDTRNLTISITDVNGKKLWESKSGNSRSVNLPVEKFASGTYFVTVMGDEGSKTIKLVKQ